MSNPLAPDRGFTLIELLAVIVITSVVMVTVVTSISRMSQQTALMSLVGGLRSMDARARLHARTSGLRSELVTDVDSRTVELIARAGSVYTLLGTTDIPSSVGLTIRSRRGDGVVTFDRTGTSDDYAVELRHDGVSKRFTYAGLTGECREEPNSP